MICKELAHKASQKIQEEPLHPGSIKLVKKGYVDVNVKDVDNGTLASELFWKSFDKFVVSQKGSDSTKDLTLLEPGTKKLTSKAKQAVRELWNKFCIKDSSSTLEYMNSDTI